MADQNLVNYIEQNLVGGFSEEEIRSALRQAGWDEIEIEKAFAENEKLIPAVTNKAGLPVPASFFANIGKTITAAVVLLIALPLLSYGGYTLYKNYQSQKPAGPQPAVQGAETQSPTLDKTMTTPAATEQTSTTAPAARAPKAIFITNLTAKPFYPKETVSLKITPSPALSLASATLTISASATNLITRSSPFAFQFPAPGKSGKYLVTVSGFDDGGQGYLATSTLTVVSHL